MAASTRSPACCMERYRASALSRNEGTSSGQMFGRSTGSVGRRPVAADVEELLEVRHGAGLRRLDLEADIAAPGPRLRIGALGKRPDSAKKRRKSS